MNLLSVCVLHFVYKYISLQFSGVSVCVCVKYMYLSVKLPISIFLMEYVVHVFSKNAIIYYCALSWFS